MTERKEGESSPHIRRMTLKDVNEVFEMGQSIPEFSVSGETTFWEKSELESWVREGADDVLLIAEANGEIVGFVLTQIHKPNKTCELTNIFVKEEYRRRGIGKVLMEETKTQVANRGVKYMYGLVNPTNEASQGLFSSVGFQRGHNMAHFEFIPK